MRPSPRAQEELKRRRGAPLRRSLSSYFLVVQLGGPGDLLGSPPLEGHRIFFDGWGRTHTLLSICALQVQNLLHSPGLGFLSSQRSGVSHAVCSIYSFLFPRIAFPLIGGPVDSEKCLTYREMDSDMEEMFRKKSSGGRKRSAPGDVLYRQLEQFRGRPYAFAGEVVGMLGSCSTSIVKMFDFVKALEFFGFEHSIHNFPHEEDIRLETTRARLSHVLQRHEELKERLSRDTDRMVFDRLQKEFEVARAAQTEEVSLEGEQWNDGLLATIRERTRFTWKLIEKRWQAKKACHLILISREKLHIELVIRYIVICCLEGARIGIQHETSFADSDGNLYFTGEPCEIYHCVLESKSFLEKMTVIEHTIPFFLPIREAENDFLSSNAIKFIDYVGEILQAYVDRREQLADPDRPDSNGVERILQSDPTRVRLIKELYGNQIKELFHSLSYNLIEFVLDDFDCKVTVSLRYGDLISTLPSRIRVLAWPVGASKKFLAAERRGSTSTPAHSIPTRLSYAEDALRTMSLPGAYAEIVLNLPRVLQQLFQSQ
ncbi:hypothetical protein Taro_039785 [Colocasia esculenta]|uniref:Centromere protein O n=1 Tax=Colocasia esculenta TaxID=4460 RepID=A0A843WSI6_COLES|nr:hypothetical protein [Colocasia esculenta]